MKKISFIVLFVIIVGFLHSQTQETEDKYPQTIVIKTLEVFNYVAVPVDIQSKMIIVNTENQVEIKSLEDIGPRNKNGEISNNTAKLKYELQKWHNLGFTVKSSTSIAPGDFFIITTYVLQKN